MTCFWDGIMAKLPAEVIRTRFTSANNRDAFITAIKQTAVKTVDITVNGIVLSDQLMAEHLEWVRDYNINGIGGGHDCSTCDPFLAQICQLFNVSITHNYIGVPCQYINTRTSATTLIFHSDTGHFW